MAERSIVCRSDEVRRWRAGEAVEIRRPVNMRDVGFIGAGGEGGEDWDDPSCWGFEADDGVGYVLDQSIKATPHQKPIRCPHGAPGETRWVRERFLWPEQDNAQELCVYAAEYDDPRVALKDLARYRDGSTRWTPATRMPRWASRLEVTISAVRCERSADRKTWEWVITAKKAEAMPCSA